jgi:hypothetical protein
MLEDHSKNDENASRSFLFIVRIAAFSVFVLTKQIKKFSPKKPHKSKSLAAKA